MSEKITKVLHLVFQGEDGRKTLRLPDPREDLTAEEVQDAMQEVVDSQIYKYRADKVVSAKVVETKTDDINITIDA